MKKAINYNIDIENIQSVITKITGIFPENSFCFSADDFSLDIIFKKQPTTVDLVLISSSQNTAAIAGNISAANYSCSENICRFTIDSIPVQITHFYCRKIPLNPGAKSIQNILRSEAEKACISSRALFILLNGKYAGKLFNPYNKQSILEFKLIELLEQTPDTISNNPSVVFSAVWDSVNFRLEISQELQEHIKNNAETISKIAIESIRDLILLSLQQVKPSVSIILLYELGLMDFMFPEIAKLAGVEQLKEYNHKDVFYHTCEVVDNIAKTTDKLWLRFAALVHDIAKPRTKRFVEGTGWTFHGHEEFGARMMKRIFLRLRFPIEQLEYVKKLVRLHLRPASLANDIVSDSAVRRLITEAGDSLDDILILVRADITSKNPAKVSKVLRNYDRVEAKIRAVQEKDEIAAFQSPVRGDEIMQLCNLKPSKTVGLIKDAIENAILTNEIENTYQAAMSYMLKIKDKFISPQAQVQREQ